MNIKSEEKDGIAYNRDIFLFRIIISHAVFIGIYLKALDEYIVRFAFVDRAGNFRINIIQISVFIVAFAESSFADIFKLIVEAQTC